MHTCSCILFECWIVNAGSNAPVQVMCLLSSLPQVFVHSILLKVNSALCVVIVTAFLKTTVNLQLQMASSSTSTRQK